VKSTPSRSAARHATLLKRMSPPVTVHLRRMYVDCRYGQLHVHTAFPSSGGFDEHVPLVCVHASPITGRAFRRLIADLGQDRSVYAPDLPGHGESEPPESPPSVAEYAAAVGDLLDTLRLREVDLLAHQTGSLVAAELALARPHQVRRVVLAGVPVARREGARGLAPAAVAGGGARGRRAPARGVAAPEALARRRRARRAHRAAARGVAAGRGGGRLGRGGRGRLPGR